jgi:hypothetical protein
LATPIQSYTGNRDLERDRDVGPGRVEEAAAQAGLRRERDCVEHTVELPADRACEVVEVLLVRDVELDDLGLLREPPCGALGQAHRPTERRQHDLGAVLLRETRHRERDRRVVEDAGDQ